MSESVRKVQEIKQLNQGKANPSPTEGRELDRKEGERISSLVFLRPPNSPEWEYLVLSADDDSSASVTATYLGDGSKKWVFKFASMDEGIGRLGTGGWEICGIKSHEYFPGTRDRHTKSILFTDQTKNIGLVQKHEIYFKRLKS